MSIQSVVVVVAAVEQRGHSAMAMYTGTLEKKEKIPFVCVCLTGPISFIIKFLIFTSIEVFYR